MRDDEKCPAEAHLLILFAPLDCTKVHESWFQAYVASLERVQDWIPCLMTKGLWDTYQFQDLGVSLHNLSCVEELVFRGTQPVFSLHPPIKESFRLRMSKEQGGRMKPLSTYEKRESCSQPPSPLVQKVYIVESDTLTFP